MGAIIGWSLAAIVLAFILSRRTGVPLMPDQRTAYVSTWETRGVPRTIGESLWYWAVRRNLDPALMAALVNHETGGRWDPSIRGAAGEVGLGQLLPEALHDVVTLYDRDMIYDPQRLVDPDYNLRAATGYLALNLQRAKGPFASISKPYSPEEAALIMYNAGPDAEAFHNMRALRYMQAIMADRGRWAYRVS